MKFLYSLSVVGLSALSVRAQSSVYGQCGGIGWTGATTCVSGSTCTYLNDYYSQCLPSSGATSTASTTSTVKTTTSTTSTSATSTSTSTVDTTSHCGQWDSVAAGPYSLLLNLWGEADATSGSQCSNLISLSGDTVSWSTTWTWTGGSSVKSFSNIQRNTGINKQLSVISSIPTTWKWTYSLSSSSTADVAYDLFTSSTSGGSGENEIMIWLANYNAGPIAQSWDASGKPVATTTNISIAGLTWNLYTGSNGYNNVYSFLLADGSTNSNFSADANLFIKYLTSAGYFSTSQYLVTAQAGSEPFAGSGTLTTSSYSLVIN